jgi:hypothetical protein
MNKNSPRSFVSKFKDIKIITWLRVGLYSLFLGSIASSIFFYSHQEDVMLIAWIFIVYPLYFMAVSIILAVRNWPKRSKTYYQLAIRSPLLAIVLVPIWFFLFLASARGLDAFTPPTLIASMIIGTFPLVLVERALTSWSQFEKGQFEAAKRKSSLPFLLGFYFLLAGGAVCVVALIAGLPRHQL